MKTFTTNNTISTFLLLCIVYAFLWASLCFQYPAIQHHPSFPPFIGIDEQNPVIDLTPIQINVPYGGSKDVLSCGRVLVSGISRLKLQHYANMYNVTLTPSISISKRWYSKVQVCFHRNSSLGLCQCEKDNWRPLQNGFWISTMSPYDQKYVDVKFGDMVTGSVSVTLEEVQQRWRYILLVVGIVLLFLAPIVSEWVPFYYASSVVVAVLAVVLVLLYQARKLMPIGRRNTFYFCIMSSLMGARSFVLHNLSEFLDSVLLNFGISLEVWNLVYHFVVLGIVLLGAALGYWLVRRYVISEDDEVNVGVAQFVKWSMLIVAVACIFLSTKDNLLAMVAVGSCLAIYYVLSYMRWHYHQAPYIGMHNLRARSKQTTPKHGRAEFLGKSKTNSPLRSPSSRLINSFRWFNSPVKGMFSPSTDTRSVGRRCDVYSTFHKNPNRKKFSEEEWEEFTEESTRQAVTELASSSEFSDWLINNADRIKLVPEDSSDDDLDRSSSDSTDEHVEQRITRLGFLN